MTRAMKKLDSDAMNKQAGQTSRPRGRRRQDIVGLQIDDFPVGLKRRLIAVADKRGTNMNDVAVAALALDFGISFDPSDRRPPTAPGDSSSIAFKMPRALRRRIKTAAINEDCAARDVVISHLTAAFK